MQQLGENDTMLFSGVYEPWTVNILRPTKAAFQIRKSIGGLALCPDKPPWHLNGAFSADFAQLKSGI